MHVASRIGVVGGCGHWVGHSMMISGQAYLLDLLHGEHAILYSNKSVFIRHYFCKLK